jgi:predicted RNA-binding protein YlxR (DUF448 family)
MNIKTTNSLQIARPARTCVGCRRIDAQDKLLRAVADATGRMRFDSGRWRAAGRGCYIHRAESCLQAAVRGGFERSMRRRLRLDDEIRAVLATSEKT